LDGSVKPIAHFLQCSIDLKKNVLRIGTTGTETPFLSERELPECARLSSHSEDDVLGQSVREAEERDLARALQNSRESGWLCLLHIILTS
jgi:DNA damage-inducible protein 1